MGVDGRGAFGFMGCLVVVGIAIAVVFGGLTLTSGIESSRADRAGAVALAEQAKAGARAAEAQARVDETEAKAEWRYRELVEEHNARLILLEQQSRQAQERVLMLAAIVEGMERDKVDRLESLLGGGTSPLAIIVAGILGVGAFLLWLWFWKYFKPALHDMGENLWRT